MAFEINKFDPQKSSAIEFPNPQHTKSIRNISQWSYVHRKHPMKTPLVCKLPTIKLRHISGDANH